MLNGYMNMKVLKVLLIAVAIIIATFFAVGAFLPAKTKVERSIIINQSVETVFNKVNSFKEFNTWSPWAMKDKTTEYIYSGAESGVGAKMEWRSDHPEVGSGSQEIIESTLNETVTVSLKFDEQSGDAKAQYFLLPVMHSGKPMTRITWSLHLDNESNIIGRYFGLMMDEWVGTEYEKGLNQLKEVLEPKGLQSGSSL